MINKDQPSETERIGKESVRNVKNALLLSGDVTRAKETIPNRRADTRKKKDLMLTLSKKYWPEIQNASVQVKSSQMGINKFVSEMTEEEQVVPGEFNQWLVNKKIFLLNGQLPREAIIAEFKKQLAAMWERWR